MSRILPAFAAIFAAFPAAASASPVYLSCTVKDSAPFTATADEAQSVVTVMVQGTPAPQRMNAAFTADRVTFGNGSVSYTLDRTTLAVVRKVHSMGWIDRGQCRIEKAPKRAF